MRFYRVRREPKFDFASLVASPFFLSELDLAHWKDALTNADKLVTLSVPSNLKLHEIEWVHAQLQLALEHVASASGVLERIRSNGGPEAVDSFEQQMEDNAAIEIDKNQVADKLKEILDVRVNVDPRQIVDLLNHLRYIADVMRWFASGQTEPPPPAPPVFRDVKLPSIEDPRSLSDVEDDMQNRRSAPAASTPTAPSRPPRKTKWAHRYPSLR